jgi:hypothetical protein
MKATATQKAEQGESKRMRQLETTGKGSQNTKQKRKEENPAIIEALGRCRPL